MEKLLWAFAVTLSALWLFLVPAFLFMFIDKENVKKINVPFIILSINIFLSSIFNIILLMDFSTINLLNLSAKISTLLTIAIPAIVLHLVIKLTHSEEFRRYRIYVAAVYSAALGIFILLLAYNQIGIKSIYHGYIIYSPFFKYTGAFYIAPIGLVTIFLTGRDIYRKLRIQQTNLQMYYLFTGLLGYFIGTSIIQILMELSVLKPAPISELAVMFLYGFICFSLYYIHSNRLVISKNRILENIGDAVFLFNHNGEVIEKSGLAANIIEEGFNYDKVRKNDIDCVISKLHFLTHEKEKLKKLSGALQNFKIKNFNCDIKLKIHKHVRYYNVRASTVFNYYGKITGKLLILNDITIRKEKEKQLYYQSYHDQLTNVFNRYYFEEELVRIDKKKTFPICIILGDINGLKIINDTFGRIKGDEFIKKTAGILKHSLHDKGVLCRYGGDEFAIILQKTGREDALKIINKMLRDCKKNSTAIIPLNVTFGFSIKTSSDQNINDVIKEAENTMYEYKLSEGKSMRSALILSLKKALEERDYETEEHAERLIRLSVLLGKKINLDIIELNKLKLLAMLHDIGKISIPDDIVLKPGKLTTEEWEVMKKHSEVGYRIAESSPDLAQIAPGILYHHERWDGSGYPGGLKGGRIPIISRILSIVDSYDAMISDRPYKKGMSKDKVLKELERCAGTQFDPYLVEKFLEIIKGKNSAK
ncbi:MAG: diguanylate cyclase [Actinomycetota bacterium]|nr:diguanylate cyclase [Actinomycetota bacterium]